MPNNQASTNSQATAIGTAIASAATLVLSNNGNIQHITGTVPINDITFPSGQVGPVLLITDAACSFVNLAGTLETDTGATITAVADGMYEVLKDTGGIVRVRSRGGASGSSAVTYTDPTTDKVLNVGDIIVHNLTAVTNLNLQCTTATEQQYDISLELDSSGSTVSGASWLYPNTGVAITAAFARNVVSNGVISTSNQDGIIAGWTNYTSSCLITVTTRTKSKTAWVSISCKNGGAAALLTGSINWNDSTTVWSQLGHLVFSIAQAGRVIIRRIA